MISGKTLVKIIRAADLEVRDYSGRGMFGKKCVAIQVERETSPFNIAASLAATALQVLSRDGFEFFIEDLADLRVSEDNLGHDTILYFPLVEWQEEYDIDGPDEEDEEDEYEGEGEGEEGAWEPESDE